MVGDRYIHEEKTKEHIHGIVLFGVENIKIIDTHISNCWGDVVAIFGANNFLPQDLVFDNNRRQTLTNPSGKNIKVIRPICENSNGTAQESGIDIGPNYPTDRLENIELISPKISNFIGAGLQWDVTNLLILQKMLVYLFITSLIQEVPKDIL